MGESGPHTDVLTWYDTTKVVAPERRALTHDLDVDLCVIGAGLAGLTIAREVARRGWSVVVIEKDRVGANASGRNAGFVSPGFAERIDAIVDRVGMTRARELWALSESGVDYVRRAIADCAMERIDAREGRLTVRRTDDESGNIEHVAMLRVEFGAEVEAWPTEQVREVLRSPSYFQGMHFANAFHIQPLNYLLGLAAAAESLGVRIFEGTTAASVDPAGVRKRVQTSGGLVRARHVVLAGNVGAGLVDGAIGATVLPIATYIAVTAPIGERLFEQVRYTGAVADTRRAGDYYRIVADDRLLWGGRFTMRLGEPRRLKAMIQRDIARTYPLLRDVEIEHAWTGTMGYALHKMPQIGALADGYWLAGTFGGHGINTTAMAGQLIAAAILDGDDRWRLFSPYELVWAGGRAGRAAVQALSWSTRARDGLFERIARYRDGASRQAAEQQAQWDAYVEKRKVEERARETAAAFKRAAEEDERRAEEAMRKAELEVRRASEQARRAAQADTARRAREHAEAIRKAREEVDDARRAIKEIADRVSETAAEPAGEAPAVPVAAVTAVGVMAHATDVAAPESVVEPAPAPAAEAEPAATVAPAVEVAESSPQETRPEPVADAAAPPAEQATETLAITAQLAAEPPTPAGEASATEPAKDADAAQGADASSPSADPAAVEAAEPAKDTAAATVPVTVPEPQKPAGFLQTLFGKLRARERKTEAAAARGPTPPPP